MIESLRSSEMNLFFSLSFSFSVTLFLFLSLSLVFFLSLSKQKVYIKVLIIRKECSQNIRVFRKQIHANINVSVTFFKRLLRELYLIDNRILIDNHISYFLFIYECTFNRNFKSNSKSCTIFVKPCSLFQITLSDR